MSHEAVDDREKISTQELYHRLEEMSMASRLRPFRELFDNQKTIELIDAWRWDNMHSMPRLRRVAVINRDGQRELVVGTEMFDFEQLDLDSFWDASEWTAKGIFTDLKGGVVNLKAALITGAGISFSRLEPSSGGHDRVYTTVIGRGPYPDEPSGALFLDIGIPKSLR